MQAPFWDQRMPLPTPEHASENFSESMRELQNTAEWHEAIADQPWTPNRRRHLLLRFLHAKLTAPSELLQLEGGLGTALASLAASVSAAACVLLKACMF